VSFLTAELDWLIGNNRHARLFEVLPDFHELAPQLLQGLLTVDDETLGHLIDDSSVDEPVIALGDILLDRLPTIRALWNRCGKLGVLNQSGKAARLRIDTIHVFEAD